MTKMKMKKHIWIIKLIVILIPAFFISCGEGTVEIGRNTYAPKIVIEGYIYPNRKIENIRITRNVPIADIPNYPLFISDADVKIQDVQTSKEISLSYNKNKMSYEYNGSDFQIDYDKQYKLSVTAMIEGQRLSASSITKVPKKGFGIIPEQSILGTMKYRERDANNNVKEFKVVFRPSAGTNFYAVSIVALDGTLNTFVYENPFFEVRSKDLEKELDNFKYQFKWLQNVNSSAENINYNVEWLDTWFYSKYRLIIYAADENFRLFSQTYKNVQEFDGNFHEPRINIIGDGIGVFGSAIADTAYFTVTK